MKTADKVRKIRELKGFSQEYMASKLDMSQNNYSKLEKGEIKITIDRLQEISKVLELDPVDIMQFDEKIFFNQCENNGGQYGYFANSISDNERILYEKIIKSLEEQIALLKKLLESKIAPQQ